MSYVHIHELPEIRYSNTKDTDIIPIENEHDTWKIRLGDLKMLFSNDNKINAIYNDLLNKINNLQSSTTENMDEIREILSNHASQISNLTEDVSDLNVRMTKAENTIVELQRRVSSLEERVTTTETNISSINKTLDSQNNRITQLEGDVTTIKSDISTLQTTVQEHGDSITSINQSIQDIIKKIEDMSAVSIDNLEELEQKLTQEIINKYEELLSIIDECHHQTPIIC